jgi:hypothetical protein
MSAFGSPELYQLERITISVMAAVKRNAVVEKS